MCADARKTTTCLIAIHHYSSSRSDRYHLYVSLACPWACRALAALHIKGLGHIIGVSVTHPTWQRTRPDDDADLHTGWVFRDPHDAPLASPAGAARCSSAWLARMHTAACVLLSSACLVAC